jgi:hypothetical protein
VLWQYALTADLCYHLHLATVAFIKFSILLFYFRVFTKSWNHKLRLTLVGTMVFVAVYTLIAIIRMIWLCNPPQDLWEAFKVDSNISYSEHCKDGGTWRIVAAALNIATDFFLTLLPMPLIGRLKIDKRQKIALLGVFALGFFVCAASIGRLMPTIGFAKASVTSDVTWILYPNGYWSMIEVAFGIMVASAPALKYFFKLSGERPVRHPPYRRNISSLWRSILKRGPIASEPLPSSHGGVETEAHETGSLTEQESRGKQYNHTAEDCEKGVLVSMNSAETATRNDSAGCGQVPNPV